VRPLAVEGEQINALSSHATKGAMILYNDRGSVACRECYKSINEGGAVSTACERCDCFVCSDYQSDYRRQLGARTMADAAEGEGTQPPVQATDALGRAYLQKCTYVPETPPGLFAGAPAGYADGRQPIPKALVDAVCSGGGGDDYVIDPTSSILRSVQCACLTATTSYLQQYKSMLTVVNACFETILKTGDGSAGTCQAVVSRYVCDMLYYALSCITESPGKGFGSRIDSGAFGFLGNIARAGRDVQDGIGGRYGGTNLYRVMFVEKKLAHSACMWMFTGDVDFDVNAMIEQSVELPIESTAAVAPATRRFMSFSALSGLTTHIYHLGFLLIAGADLQYHVSLVCSNDASCDPSEGFEGGFCDCARLGQEQTLSVTQYLGSGRLSAGDTVDEEAFVKVAQEAQGNLAKVRYDKVKVSWTWRNNNGEMVSQEHLFPVRQEGGLPPVGCSWDLNNLQFGCGYFIGRNGRAFFSKQPPSSINDLYLGDSLSIPYAVTRQNKDAGSPEPAYLVAKITRDNSQPVMWN
ncbi:hypothetical protein COY28_04320, partial [Candidatus Woesearchaeota archaeon CG_4_10_14_0_2_um_filter_57_5]